MFFFVKFIMCLYQFEAIRKCFCLVFRCVGQACSMASLLLAAGSPGMRYSLPNARIMIHQPSGGAQVCFETLSEQFFPTLEYVL